MIDFNRKITKLFCKKIDLGCKFSTQEEIDKYVEACLKSYCGYFYSRDHAFTSEVCIKRFKQNITSKCDSRAESIFCDILFENNIRFNFQHNIGPYRVDYLFDNNVILEGDGPHHYHPRQKEYDIKRDKYLRRKGYKVLRCDWDMVAAMSKEIIEILKEIISEHNDIENQ